MANERLTRAVVGLVEHAFADRYALTSLLAVGGQALVWDTRDSWNLDRRCVTRMALLPYDRLAQVEDEDIQAARHQIAREHQMLVDLALPGFPRDFGLNIDSNPLLDGARSPDVVNAEPYLVLERIQGQTMRDWISTMHRNQHFARSMWLPLIDHAIQTAKQILEICEDIETKGYLYSDISDTNLMLESADGITKVRFVDPGGIVPSHPRAGLRAPMTLAYTSPSEYIAFEERQPIWPTARSVMYSVGKLTWQLLTGRQPLPGVDPDLSDDRMPGCPEWLVTYLRDLLFGREFHSFGIALGQLESLVAPRAR